MLHIVDFDADEALLGVQRENTHEEVAQVLTSAVQALFHGRTLILQRLALPLETGASSLKNAESCGIKIFRFLKLRMKSTTWQPRNELVKHLSIAYPLFSIKLAFYLFLGCSQEYN